MNSDERFSELVSTHMPDAIIRGASPMTGGVSADATLIDIELPNGSLAKLVLREHGDNHCGLKAALEFQLLERLHSLGVTVPRPVGFSDGDGAGQHPYVLLEYIDGSTNMQSSVAEVRITAAVDKLISIHDVNTVSLPKLPPRFDPLPELLGFLPEDAEWNELRSNLSQMKSTAFTSNGVLLHGDYWPSNIVWEGSKIVGVIDWEDAAIGDPLSDVACACLELRYIYGNWGVQCFLNAYSARRHVDPIRLALWQAYVAAAGNQSMVEWGLEPSRVQTMRKVALDSIREAGDVLAIH